MREIKFRAWHGGKMTPPFDLHDYAEAYALFHEGDISGFNCPEPWEIKEGVSPIMQFTGILDSKGKEIYEGDIVFAPLNEGTYEVKFGIYDGTEWDGDAEKHNGFYIDDHSGSAYKEPCEGGEYLKVIGNVHQNPDLLPK